MGDIDSLGRLFDLAHGLLAGLRLSTPELERLVHGARAAGAIGAKLTGAGGGGAVIALAPSHRNDVLARWRATASTGWWRWWAAMSEARPPAAGVTAQRRHQHRPGQVLGQARRRPQPAGHRQPVAHPGRARHHAPACASPPARGRRTATGCCSTARRPTRRSPRASRASSIWCGSGPAFDRPAEVSTRNSVPTAAGLASSASGFAALALAATRAAGLAAARPTSCRRWPAGARARPRAPSTAGFVEMSPGPAGRRRRRHRPPAARARRRGTCAWWWR